MSTAQQRRPSLIWHLMAWMLGALVVVWASFVALGYQTGVHEADELTDGHLAGVAALVLNLEVAGAVGQGAATPVHEPPGLMAHDYQQSLSVALWDGAGRLISRTGDAPEPAFDTEQGFATLRLGPEHRAWRSFTQWSRDHARKVSVMIELQERDELADDIAGQMIEPGLWLLPVVALALGLAIRRGMRPLNELSREVERLDLAQAERVSHRHALREFMPVVNSINTLLDRQQEALERERSLANEVAHELRTPLASIALQARALGDAPAGAMDAPAQRAALARIGQDALHAGHVLSQLLALARAGRAMLADPPVPVDLAALARQVVAAHAQAAWPRGCSLSVQAPEALGVMGNAVLLELALRNLVENALKHTPHGTQIEVQAGQGPDGEVWLQVCDDGRRSDGRRDGAERAAEPVDSLHLGHEIVARVLRAHQGSFGEAAPPEGFTTCYRMGMPGTGLAAAG
ncbi:histidine kinase dimerization/phospho-acceptor domain-containing protein [Delftia tsuruhatensis]|uniref:histidine kinase dimerization/phospho-acceptor domain-containing protein n=1 Tax=Delftia tsuruhatensis TaxID=180282 RepID=UPI00244D743D|nr:histidine kinase dimerization/phospho-acceptor domain-containing protein [Delftia tsuruhatensis]MDH0417863.1 two-component sensor histidine kinase [Delftia tsuruhatensis]